MNHRSIRRLATAAALLSLLTLTAPAHAAGWSLGAPGGDVLQAAWQWIATFWSTPAHPAHGTVERKSGLDPSGLKSALGMEIDPNGGTNAATAPTCQTSCDRGMGIDPNG